MIGMNLVFHVAAAIMAIALVALLLKTQRERDLLRRIIQREAPGKILVLPPALFLRRLAQAMGIPFEAEAGVGGEPRRIEIGPLAALILTHGIVRIRCLEDADGIRFEIVLGGRPAEDSQASELSRALGGARVSLTST